MDTGNRKWLLVISIPAIMCILLIIFFSACEPSTNMPPWGRGECSRTVPSYILWISIVLMILVIVPVSYYLLSKRVDEKLERNMKIISKIINKGNSISKETPKKITEKNIILKFLNKSEKKVLEKLIENRGTALQSEISRMEGMTTLKTHRTVKDMERKGIVKIEAHGKTNRIILMKDIKDFMLK
ncbi:MAG TPA: winged helix-turn-helix transcriptional regulator [Thermoplasmatales archaeon]|nr:MAG: hypothetical protein DRN45_04950 [Thermococci archaeon]RLF95353.1 MAG: hypothetical protein DRN50_03880 [Thermococci archaeon]HEC77324.1 winged helix-turn-helix transcriptional regulator [Thermoplasmatales archaeon]